MTIKQMTKILAFLLILAVTFSLGHAGEDVSARIKDGWIIASQGSDESSQIVRVKVWGTTRVTGSFYQLDTDPEKEYVVVSRGMGSGPYYKIQIIDFRPDGILTWSYDSFGVPKVEKGAILLGSSSGGYQGAATKPVYEIFRLSVEGLSKINE